MQIAAFYGSCINQLMFLVQVCDQISWIPEPSVNNKLKRREGSGSTGGFFD
jgi:hypothetical protein